MLGESELPERLRALPGMGEVLPVVAGGPPCHLVGGGVRDLLLGAESIDIDVAVEGDVDAVAAALADRVGGEVVRHDRFGTATVRAPGLHVDFARTRRETYPAPGALPEVEPAALDEDLGRRDFTINAIALALAPDRLGSVRDPHGGRDDLAAGLVRVLHPRSFADDPTRLLRAVRYAARFRFAIEPETERLARAAVAAGAPATVSGQRLGDELLDLLGEEEVLRGAEAMVALGLDRALHPALRADPRLVASARLRATEIGADPVLTALASMCAAGADGRSGETGDGPELREWVDRLAIGAAARDAVLRAGDRASSLVDRLRDDLRPSELHALLSAEPPEALALALALGARAEPVLEYTSRLRQMRLEIDGGDLIAAGIPESPAVGDALARTLERKLDGELDSREDELRAAVDLARDERA
ncbi:MAG: hypothetical protein WD993_08835 [Thermoleophilaceae bacterium]